MFLRSIALSTSRQINTYIAEVSHLFNNFILVQKFTFVIGPFEKITTFVFAMLTRNFHKSQYCTNTSSDFCKSKADLDISVISVKQYAKF